MVRPTCGEAPSAQPASDSILLYHKWLANALFLPDVNLASRWLWVIGFALHSTSAGAASRCICTYLEKEQNPRMAGSRNAELISFT